MKITRRQLRQLINESMLQPTFFLNMKAREELLPKIVADPSVHLMIKNLLQSGKDSDVNQGVELLRIKNPEYIEELETYESHQDSIQYHSEFDDHRLNYFFMSLEAFVKKYKYDYQISDLTIENLSEDTYASSYDDRSSGRRVKKFLSRRLHGAAIYSSNRNALERIAQELESERGLDGKPLYASVGGSGQPLHSYINDYYVTAFASNLKYKGEMHKKGKYELKVYPATPDLRQYKSAKSI